MFKFNEDDDEQKLQRERDKDKDKNEIKIEGKADKTKKESKLGPTEKNDINIKDIEEIDKIVFEETVISKKIEKRNMNTPMTLEKEEANDPY